jgi:hypothetical protein
MHPHAIAENGRDCLYMQDTWLVTAEGAEPLAGLPMRIYQPDETLDGVTPTDPTSPSTAA